MLKNQEIQLAPIQQVKLELYREFGEDAKEAFDFVMADVIEKTVIPPTQNNSETTQELADGVYIIYNDGRIERYTANNSKDDVKYVGVVCNHRHIAVALHDLGEDGKEYQFLKDGFEAPENSVYYTRQQNINAFEDFAGKNNTEHIKTDYKTEIPLDLLKDDEYIAAMGEFACLMMFASTINEALEYVGGTPLKGWYWSSTELSQNYAWGVGFSDGGTNSYSKYYSGSVRAVAAF